MLEPTPNFQNFLDILQQRPDCMAILRFCILGPDYRRISDDLNSLEVSIQQLDESLDRYFELTSRCISYIESDMENLKARRARLEAETEDIQTRQARLQADSDDLQARQARLRMDAAELQTRQAVLWNDLTKLRADFEELKVGQSELSADTAELEADVDELKTGQAQLREDVAELKTGLARVRANVAELKSGNAQLTNSEDKLRATVAELNHNIQNICRRLEDIGRASYERVIAKFAAGFANRSLGIQNAAVLRSIRKPDEAAFNQLLDSALDSQSITVAQAASLYHAGIILAGADQQGQTAYAVIEVSETIHAGDVDRAQALTGIMAQATGHPVTPAVVGQAISPDARQRAQRNHVQIVTWRLEEPNPV